MCEQRHQRHDGTAKSNPLAFQEPNDMDGVQLYLEIMNAAPATGAGRLASLLSRRLFQRNGAGFRANTSLYRLRSILGLTHDA